MKTVQREWFAELEEIIRPLDETDLECDGMSRVISTLLTQSGIHHTVRLGYVCHKSTDRTITPHYWIELKQQRIIDYRLRYWLGYEEEIPDGVFDPRSQPEIEYHPVKMIDEFTLLNDTLLGVLTNGLHRKVCLAPEFVGEQP